MAPSLLFSITGSWISPAVLLILLGLAALVLLLGLRRRQSAPKPGAAEYWVYLPTAKAPTQDAILTRLMQTGAIGPQEGLLFSDIRLHMAVVLRAKNAHLFLLELLDEAIPLSTDHLDALAESMALFKVRYVCDPPAKDDRYLRLLPHLALAAAQISSSGMIYDLYQRKMFGVGELAEMLANRQDAARAEVHIRSFWTGAPEPRGHTRGLSKKGLPELSTDLMESDEENLVVYVLAEAAKAWWAANAILPKAEVEYFAGTFEVVYIEKQKDSPGANVRILRRGRA